MTVVAISVDEPQVSLKWAHEKGFTFPLASDSEQRIIAAWGLQNPDVPELSLHAIVIIDAQGKVFYRKIARRRAYPPELLDAIDFHAGRWSPAAADGS